MHVPWMSWAIRFRIKDTLMVRIIRRVCKKKKPLAITHWKRRSSTLLPIIIMKTEQSKISWCSYILHATVLGTWLSSPRPPPPGWEGEGLRSQGRKEVVPPLKEPSHSAPSANCLQGMLASPFLLVLKWYMGEKSLFDNRIVGRN